MELTLKCYMEFQDCVHEYDCTSCSVSKDYWSYITTMNRRKSKKEIN